MATTADITAATQKASLTYLVNARQQFEPLASGYVFTNDEIYFDELGEGYTNGQLTVL